MKTSDLFKVFWSTAVGLLMTMARQSGDSANEAVQRAVTIPQRDLDHLTRGMSDADKALAVQLRDQMADAIADFAVFIGSRGAIDPD